METLKSKSKSKSKPELITSVIANDIFKYDAETGKLFWKIKPCSRVALGDEIKAEQRGGYLGVMYKGRRYPVHHIIWLMAYESWPDGQIDHIDHNPKNNRLENLRDVSISVNQRNTKIPANNTSGFLGVTFYKNSKKWIARGVGLNGITKYIGSFDSKEDAIEARKAFNRKNGYHPNHGVQ